MNFPAALACIRRMESPYGTFLCEGNHDTSPGPLVLVSACERNGLRMLFNTCTTLPVRGRNLLLGGLSWMRFFQMDINPGMVGNLFPPRRENDVRILLAHHPDLFDIAQEADLVLSGHTHGGQIMLSEKIGLGPIRFKYCSGRFQRGNTTMIVSNGCGDWFPCRIGAPAEIALLTADEGAGSLTPCSFDRRNVRADISKCPSRRLIRPQEKRCERSLRFPRRNLR